MKRNASVLSFCASGSPDALERLKKRLSELDLSPETRDFGDAESLVSGLASRALRGGIIIAAAPVPEFTETKTRIIKSEFTKIVRSSAVVSAMGENVPETAGQRDLQAAVPAGAAAIPSRDGFYSAFAAKKGGSLIVVLPLDAERLEYIFDTGLDKILSDYVCEKEKENEKKYAYIAASIKKSVLSVAASGKTTAVSSYGAGAILFKAASSAAGGAPAFKRDFSAAERLPDESVEDYAARRAKISMENSKTDFGISVSGVCRDKKTGESFVAVCAANAERAAAARVFAEPGESRSELLAAAIAKLCETLDEAANGGGLEKSAGDKAVKNENPKLSAVIAFICVSVSVVACLIVAFVLGKRESERPRAGADPGDALEAVIAETFPPDGDEYGLREAEPENIDCAVRQIAVPYLTAASSAAVSVSRLPTTLLSTMEATLTGPATTLKITGPLVRIPISQTGPAGSTAAKEPTGTTRAAPSETGKKEPEKPTASRTAPPAVAGANSAGKFVFRVYGWGHGVGMSQKGAVKMAKDGKNYEEILTHYFNGTVVKTDGETPETITYGGKDIPIVEYLCRTTKREIGEEVPTEALKAQLVAVYTFAKYYGFNVDGSRHAYAPDYKYVGSELHRACLEVLSMVSDTDKPKAKYVDYDGKAAFTCYFDSSAGKTASAASVWEGTPPEKYPYLKGGAASPEEVLISTSEISAEDMKKYISDFAREKEIEIILSGDPAEWLEILSHDSAYNERVGYVGRIRIGNYEIKGNAFRGRVLNYGLLKSHCFVFEYVPATTEPPRTGRAPTAAPATEDAAPPAKRTGTGKSGE